MAVKIVNLAVCLTVCILIQGNVNAREKLNKEDAAKVCVDKNDKLMRYSNINITSKSLLNKLLIDDQAIWLQNHAIYSPFISYAGCLNISSVTDNVTKHTLVKQNELFVGVQYCQKSLYLGVMTSKSYCFLDNHYSNYKKFLVNDLHCDESREGLFNKTYNVNTGKLMTVYKILLPEEVPPSIDKMTNKSQCVYTRNNTVSSLEYFTGSCSPNPVAKGFLCARSEYHVMNDSCRNEQPCVMTPMQSLLKAEFLCHEKSGILPRVRQILSIPQQGAYLTGMFRVFQVVDDSDVCLSVRKSSTNGLVIEPGDCSLLKSSFCQNDLYAHTTIETVTTTIYKDSDLSTDIGKADEEEEDNEGSVLIYVGIILSVFCVIVSVPLFILYRHFKSKHAAVRSYPAANSEASAVDLLTNQAEKNNSEAYDELDIKEDGTKKSTIPIKPQRKTLRKPTTQSSYENFALGATTKENERYELDNNYDRINIKGTVRKNDEKPYDGELNIYNHTTNDTEEEYDTIKYKNKQPTNIKAMEDYSSLSEVQCDSKPTCANFELK